MCLLVVSGFMFTACDNDDLDTNQFTGGIKLNVFGPCPVARGGELRFIGSGMDQVTGVVIPGCDEITDITVVSNEEITVTVPQDAVEGKVILNTPQGEIETITEITYLEPVSIEDFSPKTVKPGDELVITGEYLNLMRAVIFEDGVTVEVAEENRTRNEIRVIVPAEAQTGFIGVTDLGIQKGGTPEPNGIANEIYSEEELTVTLPAVSQIVELTGKKPGDVVTITGTDLDLVTTVLMPNDSVAEFAYVNEALNITLRDDATDGAIRMLPASGVEVVAANLTMAVPTELAANPATGLRGGNVITITGVDLDVVTNVTFPGMTDATELDTQSATEITVTMPAAAQSGDIVLNTASGKTATVAIATLKPAVASYSPAGGVGAGNNLTISGSDLDLVASVAFTGGASVSDSMFVSHTATEIVLTVPTSGANTGALTLTMVNGEVVEAPEVAITAPDCAYLPTLPESIEVGTVAQVGIVNGSMLTGVSINGTATQFIYIAATEMLQFNVPADLTGATCELVLTSSNGQSMTYTLNVVGGGPAETTIWEGEFTLAWNGFDALAWGAYDFSTVPAGTTLVIYYTLDTSFDYWQLRVAKGNGWAALADWSASIGGGTEVGLEAGTTSYSYTLTANDVNELANDGGLILTGTNLTLTRVALSGI